MVIVMLIIIIIGAFDIFLMMLNTHFRGAFKPYIDAVLSIIWVATVISSFIIYNWKYGLLFMLGSFLWGAITMPISARIAKRIFNH